MLDRNLTITKGLEKIGDIKQESTIEINSNDCFTKNLLTTNNKIRGLIKEKIIHDHFYGLVLSDNLSKNEKRKIHNELIDAIGLLKSSLNILLNKIAIKQENLDIHFNFPLINVLQEAVINAIEHGVDYCINGNIYVDTKIGNKGVLAVVSQATPGITKEKAKYALSCNDPMELSYTSNIGQKRGNGLACFVDKSTPYVWFDFWAQEKPAFKTIILETRNCFGDFMEINE